MPLSGNITVKSRDGQASNGSVGAPIPYTPSRSDAAGPIAPQAPLPSQGAPLVRGAQQMPDGQQAAEGQETTQEGTPEAQDLAYRLGIVAQKDKQARLRLQAAKAAEARARGEAEAMAAREAAIRQEEDRRDAWRRDPMALLRDHGFNPESALQFMLNGGQLTPEQKLAATVDSRLAEAERRTHEEITRVRDEEAQRESQRAKAYEQQQREQQQQEAQFAVREFKQEIADFLEADPTYKVVTRLAGPRGVDAIFEEIDRQFQATGKRVSTKQAADTVRAMIIKDAQERLADQEIAEALGVRGGLPPPPPQRQAAPRTLTNGMGAPAGVQPQAQQRAESEAEKRARVAGQIEAMFRRVRG